MRDLDDIEAGAAAATEGPWELVGMSTIHINGRWTYTLRGKGKPGQRASIIARPADAEFIAHARADVPEMAAEIRRLRARERRADCVDCAPPIPQEELRVDVFRAGFCKPDVRVTHLPTGLFATSAETLSEGANRAHAMAELRRRLLDETERRDAQ